MDADTRFHEAVDRARQLPNQPNDILLKLYGLYKQATAGDVAGSRPEGFDFRGQAKFDAWSACKGMTAEHAKAGYADLVDTLAG